MQLISAETRIDFVSQARLFALLSLVAVVVSIALMGAVGFNLGIDFRGGMVIQITVPEVAGPVEEGRVRAALADLGHGGAIVTRFGPASDRAFRISLNTSQEEDKDLSIKIVDGLSAALGTPDDPVRSDAVDSIGARVGRELTRAGASALLMSWALILIYIWFRFDLRYAPGAVAALVHDVTITAGVFVLFGWEFNLQVLAALLVVIGYSLNDTIVIYDRIRENIEKRGATHLEDVVNQSVNQTLSRTLLTSLTTLGVVAAILVLGGPVIRDFALAMFIGVVIGTYSTIYVASALLIALERRFGESAAQQAGATGKSRTPA